MSPVIIMAKQRGPQLSISFSTQIWDMSDEETI